MSFLLQRFFFTAGLSAPYREFPIGNFFEKKQTKIPIGNFKNPYREFFRKKQTKIPIGIPYREFQKSL